MYIFFSLKVYLQPYNIISPCISFLINSNSMYKSRIIPILLNKNNTIMSIIILIKHILLIRTTGHYYVIDEYT